MSVASQVADPLWTGSREERAGLAFDGRRFEALVRRRGRGLCRRERKPPGLFEAVGPSGPSAGLAFLFERWPKTFIAGRWQLRLEPHLGLVSPGLLLSRAGAAGRGSRPSRPSVVAGAVARTGRRSLFLAQAGPGSARVLDDAQDGHLPGRSLAVAWFNSRPSVLGLHGRSERESAVGAVGESSLSVTYLNSCSACRECSGSSAAPWGRVRP